MLSKSVLWQSTKSSRGRRLLQKVGTDSHHIGDSSNGQIDASVNCLGLEYGEDSDWDVKGDFRHVGGWPVEVVGHDKRVFHHPDYYS